MHRNMITATALATVVVAAAGCSTRTVSGAAIAPPKAAIEQVPATPSTTTAPASRWVTAPWTGKVSSESMAGHQWSAVPVPGAATMHHSDDGGPAYQACTIGPAIRDASGSSGFLTAGHCTKSSAQYVIDSQEGTVKIYGSASPSLNGMDAAPVWTPITPAVTRIAGRWPVAGVLTAAAAGALPPGTPICIDGAVSGVSCSTVVSAPGSMAGLTTAPLGQKGDSGSAVFVVGRDGRTALVGLHNGGTATTSTVVLLEPVLEALKAEAVIDPAATPFTGDEFSARVRSY
ncbi:MAG: hypothetical protein H6523_12910 [Mycolicibacterium sp.]|nr:hypothetical protein [Mycolicibacterium sp.]